MSSADILLSMLSVQAGFVDYRIVGKIKGL